MKRDLRRTVRLLAVGVRTYLKHQASSGMWIVFTTLTPVVYAMIAFYLLRAGDRPDQLAHATAGAGIMGVWTSVLFGSGATVQRLRWMGVLEPVAIAPAPLLLTLLPVTLVYAIVGLYSIGATLVLGGLIFHVPLDFATSVPVLLSFLVCLVSMGMMGLLLTSTFVHLRNAHALNNTLDHPIWMLSGMLVPIALPGWLGPVADVLPTTWGARALHTSIDGGSAWSSMAAALVLGLIYLGLSAVALKYVEHKARAKAMLALS
ncbi:ABC transporter permease [Streptomyces tendae]|uniref:ABC transporter permease n=1 Tax=Streptomyces tendae TaxID=1932 RepID=UPI0037178CCE